MDHNRVVKTFLALLISCLTLSAATTYPMLSTTSNRTVDGGLTNLAVLNSNNVFTGSNVFSGVASLRSSDQPFTLLFSTNIFVAKVPYVTAAPTNNGDYANTTGLIETLLPAISETNAEVAISYSVNRTNGQPSAGGWAVYLGESTNYIYSVNNAFGSGAAVGRAITAHPGIRLFQNYGSTTNQVQQQIGSGGVTLVYPVGLVNTATNWWFRLGFFNTGAGTTNTNYIVESIMIWKVRRQ